MLLLPNYLDKLSFRLRSNSPFSPLKQVAKPRAGVPINDRFALVFGENYRMKGPWFNSHPFDTLRFARIFAEVVRKTSTSPKKFYVPEPISDEDILLVHGDYYLRELKDPLSVAQHLECPWLADLKPKQVDALLSPFRHASGGTLLAAREALRWGVGINIGGGFHHAKPRKGEGFCIFADIPIAMRKLKMENKIGKSLVIDLDVHQGNGTVACVEPKDECFTFSMHEKYIYPEPKEDGDMDIELRDGMDDDTYLGILKKHLPEIFEESQPDIVFYVAGCDVLKGDPLASLKLTPKGVMARDWMVVNACLQRNIPVVMTMAGGYRKDAWKVQANSIANIVAHR